MGEFSISETGWTNRLCGELTRLGAQVFPLVASRYTPDGWPDRLIHHKSWIGLLEFKGPLTRVDPKQKQRIALLRQNDPHGCYIIRIAKPGAWICDEFEARLAWFDGSGADLLKVLVELRKPVAVYDDEFALNLSDEIDPDVLRLMQNDASARAEDAVDSSGDAS